jgi:hypothetical protein
MRRAFAQSAELIPVPRCDGRELIDECIEVSRDPYFESSLHVAVRQPGVERSQGHGGQNAELFIQLAERSPGQPMDAPVDRIFSAVPGRADAAERKVMLDDRRSKAAT